MGTAREDYIQFVRWLHEDDRQAPEGARQLANLVLTHFDTIARTSRQHNNRSNSIAGLARQHLTGTDAGLPPIPAAIPQGDWPWTSLRRFTLGPFRGFRHEQAFELNRRLVLCYGPNGSGKSSFCEGLEYALLGSVEEAGNNRLDEAEYLTNIHAGQFTPPVLTATNRTGQEVAVQANSDTFRFCFIEKSRIDSFSRIAARPPGRRAELIAALFGMDQFNDFAGHFNDSMEAVLNLGISLQTTLIARRQSLAADEAIVIGVQGQLDAHDEAASAYASGIAEGLTYEGLKALIGDADAPGRLQELDTRLNATPPAITGLTRQGFIDIFSRANSSSAALLESASQLEARKSHISFRDLYQAVSDLQPLDSDHCPACKTPIASTKSNPFQRAKTGLDELAELATLENEQEIRSTQKEEAVDALLVILTTIGEFILDTGETDSAVRRYIQSLGNLTETDGWWTSISSTEIDTANQITIFDQILAICDRAAQQDIYTQSILNARATDIQERDQLNDARVWVAENDAKRNGILERSAAAEARVTQWEIANAELIQQADREAQDNLRDRPIQLAYSSFIAYLRTFRSQLPGMLMANLNQVAIEIYNEFNHTDRDEDKLFSLRLPLTGEDRIDISFRGRPTTHVDALAVLSEGHIRCLGLAILLAKSLSIRAPVIIFDDAINAIDHEHRSGIRAALFESDRFHAMQIIVTCHSPEFIKDIENHLPPALRNDCRKYVLRHHIGDYQPRVVPDAPTNNYIARANEAMNLFDPRDALSHSRKALEMLLDKSWKWLDSHNVGDLSVKLDGPGREPQLRMLGEALRHKLTNTPTFQHASKDPLLNELNRILGIPVNTLVWTLLNKGAHEEPDRDDFDLTHVELVISTLTAVEQLELRPNR